MAKKKKNRGRRRTKIPLALFYGAYLSYKNVKQKYDFLLTQGYNTTNAQIAAITTMRQTMIGTGAPFDVPVNTNAVIEQYFPLAIGYAAHEFVGKDSNNKFKMGMGMNRYIPGPFSL